MALAERIIKDLSPKYCFGTRHNEHTPLIYEILDCEDFMCFKYIERIGRNQDEQCYFLHRQIRII